jgi:hypothetical protein
MLRRMDARKRREKQRWKDAVEMARRSHDRTYALWQQREKRKGLRKKGDKRETAKAGEEGAWWRGGGEKGGSKLPIPPPPS